MKRIWNLALCALLAGTMAACGTAENKPAETPAEGGETATEASGPVSLNVTTTFAGEDGNAQNFKNSVAAWESKTGNKVVDTSATSDENFKTIESLFSDEDKGKFGLVDESGKSVKHASTSTIFKNHILKNQDEVSAETKENFAKLFETISKELE